jgi:hypothetical protein
MAPTNDTTAEKSTVDGRLMNRPPLRFVDLKSAVGLLYDIQLGRLVSAEGITSYDIGVPDEAFLRRTFIDGMSLYDMLNGGGGPGPGPGLDPLKPEDLPYEIIPGLLSVTAYVGEWADGVGPVVMFGGLEVGPHFQIEVLDANGSVVSTSLLLEPLDQDFWRLGRGYYGFLSEVGVARRIRITHLPTGSIGEAVVMIPLTLGPYDAFPTWPQDVFIVDLRDASLFPAVGMRFLAKSYESIDVGGIFVPHIRVMGQAADMSGERFINAAGEDTGGLVDGQDLVSTLGTIGRGLVSTIRNGTTQNFLVEWPAGMADGEVRPVVAEVVATYPWNAMSTHAQINDWAEVNFVAYGPDWNGMTLAQKRAWLVGYFDGARPWEAGE